MRRFVIGDIHGHLTALEQCLERSGFSDQDRLISLGDVCDRGPKTLECIQRLMQVPDLVYIMGNHDFWTLRWLRGDFAPSEDGVRDAWSDYSLWYTQGGLETIQSITKGGVTDEFKPMVLEFLTRAKPYHEEDRLLFVHGGIVESTKAERNVPEYMMWDRSLLRLARLEALSSTPVATEYDEVFVGHTPTQYFDSALPLHYSNVWALDTGVCYSGPLTIMDVDTKAYWQSDAMTGDVKEGE